jgi:hypothetical protein
VSLVRTDISEKLSASFIRVTIIGELGTLAVTRMVAKEPQGITSQKTTFFIVTAVKNPKSETGKEFTPTCSICTLKVQVQLPGYNIM